MAFDEGRAWAELAEMIEDREGWGSDKLLATMRKLETKHARDETWLERMLRLYGDRLTLVVDSAEGAPAGELRALPGAAEEPAASLQARGGHDDGRTSAGARG